jgi:hypothetical protein
MTIDTRPGEESKQKITASTNSKYSPLRMSDESVFDMARHWYTLDEVAERFNVDRNTVSKLHGDAYAKGKAEGFNKPRMLLNKILSDFGDGDLNFANPDAPMGVLLKAIELHARKYEGLGSKQTIVHEGKMTYDGVESRVEIIEKPGTQK